MYKVKVQNLARLLREAKKVKERDKKAYEIVRDALLYYANNNLSLEGFSPSSVEVKSSKCELNLFEVKYKKVRLYFEKHKSDGFINIAGVEYVQSDKRMGK
jgi:hypothetical protein